MHSSRGAKHSVLSLIPPESEGEILEMGSGWGTLAIPLAKRCPKAKVLAYELSPIPWLYSNLLKRLYGLENLEFHRKDFQKVDLKRASLVVSYLFPEVMEKLRRKFEKELPKNTMVITHTFRVPGWTPKGPPGGPQGTPRGLDTQWTPMGALEGHAGDPQGLPHRPIEDTHGGPRRSPVAPTRYQGGPNYK